jgi:hypothetical protein
VSHIKNDLQLSLHLPSAKSVPRKSFFPCRRPHYVSREDRPSAVQYEYIRVPTLNGTEACINRPSTGNQHGGTRHPESPALHSSAAFHCALNTTSTQEISKRNKISTRSAPDQHQHSASTTQPSSLCIRWCSAVRPRDVTQRLGTHARHI